MKHINEYSVFSELNILDNLSIVDIQNDIVMRYSDSPMYMAVVDLLYMRKDGTIEFEYDLDGKALTVTIVNESNEYEVKWYVGFINRDGGESSKYYDGKNKAGTSVGSVVDEIVSIIDMVDSFSDEW